MPSVLCIRALSPPSAGFQPQSLLVAPLSYWLAPVLCCSLYKNPGGPQGTMRTPVEKCYMKSPELVGKVKVTHIQQWGAEQRHCLKMPSLMREKWQLYRREICFLLVLGPPLAAIKALLLALGWGGHLWQCWGGTIFGAGDWTEIGGMQAKYLNLCTVSLVQKKVEGIICLS